MSYRCHIVSYSVIQSYRWLSLGGVLPLCREAKALADWTTYVVPSISFQTFCYKIVEDSWKFTMLLLYILWDDWTIFMISAWNVQLQQQLEYNLQKPNCHSWWISKMQSGCEDTLEERYAIKFCFQLGINAAKKHGMLNAAFGPSCMNRASVFEIQWRSGVCEAWWEV